MDEPTWTHSERYKAMQAERAKTGVELQIRDWQKSQENLASFRDSTNQPVEPRSDLDQAIAALAATNPRFNNALNVSQRFLIQPMDEHGEPLDIPPTADPEKVLSLWEGPAADLWCGIPCGPATGLFALDLGIVKARSEHDRERGGDKVTTVSDGEIWLKEMATEKVRRRPESLVGWLRPMGAQAVALAGVPDVTADEDSEPAPIPYVRETFGVVQALAEAGLADPGPLHLSYRGGPESAMRAIAELARLHPKPRVRRLWVWRWAEGLPVGRKLRDGVRSLSVLPSRDSVIRLDDVPYTSVNGGYESIHLQPPPDWLLDILRKL